MTMRLHVERLALEGIALNGAERARLERAVIGELTRLLEAGQSSKQAPGAFVESGAVALLHGAAVPLATGRSTASLGVQVARSVYGAIAPMDGRLVASSIPGEVRGR